MSYDHLSVDSLDEWRRWLAAHHDRSPGIWLVTAKKNDEHHIPYDDLVDEAICFGWVDSRPRTVDAHHSGRMMTPRRPGSSWSRVNKERVQRLTAAGRMAPAGLAAVRRAQQDGSWTTLDEVENLSEPPDLAAALDRTGPARRHWDGFPRSAKRAILEWLNSAKTDATRARRIDQIVSEAAQGRRANQWRQPRSPS
jgi:uncharacterized protein YdeI (YjbR/CyaY-like superfamily)